MNNRHSIWILAGLLVASVVMFTACGGVAPVEEPVVPEEPVVTEAPAAPEEPAATETPDNGFPPPIVGEFECTEGDNMVCTIGENEDVIVIIPWQPEHAAFLYAISLPMGGELEDFKNKERDEFSPHRLVINLELVLDRDNPEFYISEFNPEINLGIRYFEEDVKAVGGLENLEMGFWDEENGYWVSFAQHDKYNFVIEGDEAGGYVWVKISSWGDRHIGCDG
jgi:hypothetical protein